MIKQNIRYLTISDIHFGNKRNPTTNIIKNLKTWFNNYKTRNDIDFLFIPGDIFDSEMRFSSTDVDAILLWAFTLLEFCAKSNIRVRIVLGTYSHDYNQSKIFGMIADIAKLPVDYKYITKLEIEIVEDLNLSILYIPDEWRSDNRVTLTEVKELMQSYGLEQVDIAMMHGAFDYQLPVDDKSATHDKEEYEKLVKYYINIGHVHNFSTNGKIVAQGSFDRLVHGDEGKKGGTLTVIRPDGSKEFVFIENKDAMLFKTVAVKYNDLDRSVEQIRKYLSTLPDGSNLRVQAKKDHPIFSVLGEISKEFPFIRITKLSTDIAEVAKVSIYTEDTTVDAITITEENLTQQLLVRIDPSLHDGVMRVLPDIT
jgi:DNA repair exonuclease SbcCD nuclease subunit